MITMDITTQTPKSHRQAIKDAFQELRTKHGFVARMNFMCCQGCAWSQIGNDLAKKGLSDEDQQKQNTIFFHQQGNESFRPRNSWSNSVGDVLNEELYLYHSGNAQLAIDVLCSHGLDASWNGDAGEAIVVTPAAVNQDEKTAA